MSIVAKLALLARHGFTELESLLFGPETARTMHVPPDLKAHVKEPFADTEEGERLGELRGWLDNFLLAGEISVSEDPDNKPRDVMLARVHPVEMDFWSIRVTEPDRTPGIRVLGAFIAQDEFVALTWSYREDMTDFDGDVQAAIARWKEIFGARTPLKGGKLDEYLTNYYAV